MPWPRSLRQFTAFRRVAVLLIGLVGWRCAADSTAVFNELMYHPASRETDLEWIELYNQMAVNMDISNWSLAAGIEFTFPEGTVLRGGGYLVVAVNPAALIAATGATNVLGPFAGRLSNSGETIELRNNNRRLMDEIRYGTDGDWPVAPDGTGVSLAKRHSDLASAPAENWRMSAQIEGTPGTANFPSKTATPPVLLITTAQEWHFDNSGADRGTGWSEPAFDDRAWSKAPAPFFGGDAPPPGGDEQSIPTLFNTGVGPDGLVLTPGSIDPHYVVTASAQSVVPPPPAPALVIQGHPAWLANDDQSSWLGPINPGTVSVAPGGYRCRTTFDLTGFDPSSAALTLAVAADNRLNNVFLNGSDKGVKFVGFSAFSPDFKINSGFIAGLNTLEFRWANDSTDVNPAGFRAKLSGTARRISPSESQLRPVRPTTYFRTRFTFQGNRTSTLLTLRPIVDDGAVFFLNGVEVLRLNLPGGSISFGTPASTNITGQSVLPGSTIPTSSLRIGTNVLAVELHQAVSGLNDTAFSLELSAEPVPASTAPSVVFNEIAGAAESLFFAELANRSATDLALEGYVLARNGAIDADYIFPHGSSLPANGLLALTQTELGFRPESGDSLALFTPGRVFVADAVVIKSTVRGRFPDATGVWLLPARATPGLSNAFVFHHDIVINEILYHPFESSSSESWIELFNRGTQRIDLTDWRFDDGVRFRFPRGTTLPAGGYLVLAKEVASFRALHPGVAVVGPFTNTLSHHSDLLLLKDAAGNPADAVRYFDGGRWPKLPDGGGSSLELRNPDADNSAAEAWAPSRESTAARWNNYSYQAVATNAPGPTRWREFVLGLLDAGECLVDDLSVIESSAGTSEFLLQNGTFEEGAAAWRFLGTHRLSRVIPDPDDPNNHVLHLVATGPTEHMHNHLETTLANDLSVVNGRVYKVSFRAKWLAGDNHLNSRLYFNRVAKTTLLAVPSPNGTPGARNSTYEENIGPTFAHLQATPVLPQPNQAVMISVEAQDPQGVSSARVFWSLNGEEWASAPLAAKPGSPFSGVIPGAPAGTVVQYYVEATDTLGASATFPAAGPDGRALYIVNDQQARFGKVHNIRIIMTPNDTALLHAETNVMSNEYLQATVLYDEQQTFHNVGVHLQGSERGRGNPGRVGFTLDFPPDQLFRGVHGGISIDRSGGYTGVGGDQDEIVLKHALQHAGGLPGMYDDLVRVIAPRGDLTGPGLLLMAKYGDVFLDSQYANGAEGGAFKLELIYYPTTTEDGDPESPKLPQPDNVLGVDLGNLGNDPEVYRWFYLQENNRRRNDYTPMITLAKALSKTGTALDTESRRLMDVDMWMRAVAFQSLWGLVDTYPFDNPHNFIVYFRPEDGRALPFLWDMDFNFGAATDSPLNRVTGNLRKITALPGNQRRLLWHALDLITTTYNTNYLAPWITHFGGLVGQDFSRIRSYVDQRAKSVRSQLPPQIPFTITSNDGQDFLVNTPETTLGGRAWIDVTDIRVESQPAPRAIQWTTTTNWQTPVPLILGINSLNFLAYDIHGNVVGTDSVNVTSTAVGGGLDTDGDGMPDVWEIANRLNPAVADGDLDSDHDGLTNREEYLTGTNPLDSASVLKLDVSRNAVRIRLSFLARAGRSYTILARDAFDSNVWQRLSDVEPQAGDHPVSSIVLTAKLGAARFYRVMTPRMP